MVTRHRLGLIAADSADCVAGSDAGPHATPPSGLLEAARCLKAVARELNLPVILCARLDQVSVPDLDATLGLADLALRIGETVRIADSEGPAGAARVEVLRNRNGPLGSFELLFNAESLGVRDVP